MRIMNYIQPEIISHIPNDYISEESDYCTKYILKNRRSIIGLTYQCNTNGKYKSHLFEMSCKERLNFALQ